MWVAIFLSVVNLSAGLIFESILSNDKTWLFDTEPPMHD